MEIVRNVVEVRGIILMIVHTTVQVEKAFILLIREEVVQVRHQEKFGRFI